MKRRIIFGLLIAAIFLLCIVIMTACGSKEAVSAETFKQKAEELNYTVVDLTDQFEDYPHVLKCYVFANDEDIHVEFYEVENADKATGMFNTNRATIESYKGTVSSNSEVNLNSYSKYTLKTDEMYYVAERVGATMIYAECAKANAKILDDFINALGY